MPESEAERLAREWHEEARQLRIDAEYLCKQAGRRFDAANRADDKADYYRRIADERRRELESE
jgi:hypothetical protein